MKRPTKLLVAGVGTALAAWTAWGLYSGRSAEGVPYESLRSVDGVELRRYPRTLLAETTAPNQVAAFRRLFDYISGANESSESVSMTAPVRTEEPAGGAARGGERVGVTAPVRADRGETVSMTAPVRTDEEGDGVRMAFYLPRGDTLETAPMPTNSDVRLVVEGPKTMAVERFSWYATSGRVANAEQSLLDTLEREGIEVRGEPTLWQYDDPYTPPFMRRNEVAVEVNLS
ncbi:heme-binding protein [Halogeometricum sp. CBA1124]|uniref:SOUL family heme-binding protein n=1 Tax=Halogeometricum sp. CBA1124 TaxID=2668071 RepID=UPI00142AF425|nr:heme-binding protein [Halogeometricum sp. CBA1124]MUV59201.1 heme-binding protein [Halogeometricum sp. CBA1124]